jgi:hypothetical protein
LQIARQKKERTNKENNKEVNRKKKMRAYGGETIILLEVV